MTRSYRLVPTLARPARTRMAQRFPIAATSKRHVLKLQMGIAALDPSYGCRSCSRDTREHCVEGKLAQARFFLKKAMVRSQASLAAASL
jgi:hypothetical protein